MELANNLDIQADIKCHHCQGDIVSVVKNDEEQSFCCRGCLSVHGILQNFGLSNYYELTQAESKLIPQAIEVEGYDYLKDQDFIDSYKVDDGFLFYVRGIECFACNWLFDNIKELSPFIQHAYYDHSFKSLKIQVSDDQYLFQALLPILQLGYDLEPIKEVQSLEVTKKQDKRTELIRLAVAMLVMGNIGTLSLSDYLGVEGSLLIFLQNLSAFIFVVIPTYCSIPFYQTTWSMLKVKRISLDLPISISIIAGSFISYFNLLTGNNHIYFDSLATLVFLILGVRFILNRVFEKAVNEHSGIIQKEQVYRIENNKKNAVHTSLIKVGDIVEVDSNQLCLVEGMVVEGFSYMNESLMTGEATPILKTQGDRVFKGSFNYSHRLIVKVLEENKTNPIENFLNQVKQRSLAFSNFSEVTRNYSIALVGIYAVSAVGLFVMLDFQTAIERFLALTIVGCPCALGIGIPLASVLANKKLENQGIIVKDPNFFEKLAEVDQIFLDKTGTITTGEFDVLETHGDPSYLRHLVSLEQKSNHPIALSIIHNWPEVDSLEVKSFAINPGEGVSGYIDGLHYQVGKSSVVNGISLLKEGEEVFHVELVEKTRDEDVITLNELANDFPTSVLSGDSDTNVKAILSKYSEKIDYHAALKPEDKAEFVKKHKALFVGDGLNDIPAMTQAHLSVSFNIHDLVNQACHCVLTNPSLRKLQTLFRFSKRLEKLILSNIYFSAFYNLLGAYAAISGYITPLVAAIFMPVSSIGIVVMTLTKSRRL